MLTDKEIVKALNCCIKNNSCDGCPMHTMNCTARVPMAFAIDLINRQKAEIERLEKRIENHSKNRTIAVTYNEDQREEIAGHINLYHEEIRAEAIKEFAEKVDELTKHTIDDEYMIWKFKFDSLVEEMVGTKKCIRNIQ